MFLQTFLPFFPFFFFLFPFFIVSIEHLMQGVHINLKKKKKKTKKKQQQQLLFIKITSQ